MTEAAQRLRSPVPTSVSEQARTFLAAGNDAVAVDLDPESVQSLPAPDDVERWLRHIEQTDRRIAQRFAGLEFPAEIEDTEISGVHAYVLRPSDLADDPGVPIFLDFHGGALLYGGAELCRLMAAPGAMVRAMITWAADYRMPPLHPYPAPLDDAVALYRALLEQRPPEDIFVGGASAGGNLASALMVRAREEGLPRPAGLVLLSPEVDLTESGDTFSTLLGIDNVLSRLMPINLLYANGHDLADPHLSPLFADVSGFPPTFLQSGTRDLFLSNTVRMHRRLRDAGVEAELHVWEAMPHGGFAGAPEDLEVQMEARKFLDNHRRR